MQPSPSSSQSQTGDRERGAPSLVDRIAALTHLSADDAATALSTVLCIFEQRLGGGEARKLEAGLQHLVTQARAECSREDEERAEPFDLGVFYSRAAARLPGSGLATGHIVAAVLAALRERLHPRLAAEVGNELPADLRTLWDEPLPREAPVEPLPTLLHNKSRRIPLSELAAGKPNRSKIDVQAFLRQLSQRASLSEPEAESVAVATLWLLVRRVPAGVGEKLSEELPREIQVQLQDAMLDASVPDWGLDGFYYQVAELLGIRRRDVVPLVHHVLEQVRENLPADILRKVGGELPLSMKDLWLGTPWRFDDPDTC